jgi:hypothetical protein
MALKLIEQDAVQPVELVVITVYVPLTATLILRVVAVNPPGPDHEYPGPPLA